MTTPNPRTSRMPTSPGSEQELLLDLRARYGTGSERFSRQELARLRFLRWLYHTEKGRDSR